MKIIFIELNLWYSTVTYQLVLTPISDFIHSSKVTTIWQTNGTVHRLKPRLFHKFTLLSTEFTHSVHYQANPIDFCLLV